MNAGIGLLTCVRLNDGKHFLFASKGVVRHLLRFAKPRFSGEVAIGNSHSCSSRHSRMRIRRASKASRPRNFANHSHPPILYKGRGPVSGCDSLHDNTRRRSYSRRCIISMFLHPMEMTGSAYPWRSS